jgi:beta-galactosidase
MYPSFDSLRAFSADPRADRRFITCEYAYSQGNSTGSLADYWELFESLPGLQGGFIWEFADHALDPEGDGRYRYGGDFDDEPNNGPVLLNGIVFPDLTPKPALYEARGIFSPVRIVSDARDALAGRVTLRNRQTFARLGAYTLEVQVETRTGPVGATPVPIPDLAPGAETELELPESIRELLASASPLALTATVRTREDALWAPAGTTVAVQQVTFPRRPQILPVGGDAQGHIGPDGVLRHAVLRRPPQLCLWRALTDNDMAFGLDHRFVRTGFFQLTPEEVNVDRSSGTLVVTTLYTAAFGDVVEHRRGVRVVGEDDYVLQEQVTLPQETSDGLRVGMEFELIEGFERAEWVGLGPWENYPDRRTSALLGAWDSAIDDLAVPYILPQENGTRGEVTELRVAGPAGIVQTSHATPLHINVGRYSTDQLEDAAHWWELPPARTTVVHLDVAHRGVGTAQLGPDTRPAHRLSGSEYSWTWRLTLRGPA